MAVDTSALNADSSRVSVSHGRFASDHRTDETVARRIPPKGLALDGSASTRQGSVSRVWPGSAAPP